MIGRPLRRNLGSDAPPIAPAVGTRDMQRLFGAPSRRCGMRSRSASNENKGRLLPRSTSVRMVGRIGWGTFMVDDALSSTHGDQACEVCHQHMFVCTPPWREVETVWSSTRSRQSLPPSEGSSASCLLQAHRHDIKNICGSPHWRESNRDKLPKLLKLGVGATVFRSWLRI